VTALLALTWFERLDRTVLHWVNCDLALPWVQDLLFFLQRRSVGIPLVVVLIGCIAGLRGRRVAARTFCACLLGFLVSTGVAEVMWTTIARPRPPRALETVLRTPEEIATCASRPDAVAVRMYISRHPGFPSQHAASAAAFATALFLAVRWIGVLAAVYAVLVAMARLVVGTHWPSDVTAGLVLGTLAAWASWWCVPRVLGRLGRRAWVEAPPVKPDPEGTAGADVGRG